MLPDINKARCSNSLNSIIVLGVVLQNVMPIWTDPSGNGIEENWKRDLKERSKTIIKSQNLFPLLLSFILKSKVFHMKS